jgi:hypothetical protein
MSQLSLAPDKRHSGVSLIGGRSRFGKHDPLSTKATRESANSSPLSGFSSSFEFLKKSQNGAVKDHEIH